MAGHNAVRHALDMQYLTLPDSVATGDFVSFVHRRMQEPEGLNIRYTFSGSVFFARMKERGLYSTDSAAIRKRVAESGLAEIYETCLV